MTGRERNKSTLFAVEGRPFYLPLVVLAIIVAIAQCAWWTLLFAGLAAFVVFFFRSPPRNVPDEEGAVISPADGKVIQKKELTEDDYLDGMAIKVSVFMNVFNVHVNRAPCGGKIVRACYQKGKFINASFDKASELNERNTLLMETENGKKLLFVQIAGLIARRIVCYVKEGDILERGERFGLIRFGSRVDIYFPPDADIKVKIGDKVLAGETILGYIK